MHRVTPATPKVSDMRGHLAPDLLVHLGISPAEFALPSGMRGRVGPDVLRRIAGDGALRLPSGMRGEVDVTRLRLPPRGSTSPPTGSGLDTRTRSKTLTDRPAETPRDPEVPIEDALDQARDVIDERGDNRLATGVDVPEADALEQARVVPVSGGAVEREPAVPPDVPQADALDQAREVPLDDEV
jgi:hypothetical protein